MEAFLQFAGMAGLPTSFVGLMLFLYFTVRKQEAVVRTEQLEHIERLGVENDKLRSRVDELEELEYDLRKQINEADTTYRKTIADKDLELAKQEIELLRLGYQEEQTHGTE